MSRLLWAFVHLRRLLWVLGALSAGYVMFRALQPAGNWDQIDISVYLLGGRHVFGHDLYTARTSGVVLPFLYPPFAALLFAPLAHLPHVAAQRAWAVCNVGALVALAAVSLHAVRPGLSRRDLLAWGLVLATPAYYLEPVRLTFDYGQINILLVLLVMADLTTGRHLLGRRIPEGVLVGVAGAVKLTPLVFAPFLWLVGRRRAARTTMATFVVIAIGMLAVAPFASWSFWTKDAWQASRVGVAFIGDQNVQSLLIRLHHGAVPGLVVYPVVVVVGVAGLALAVWATRASSPLLGILVAATTGLLVSPISWSHHMVWIVPLLFWLCLAPDRPRWGRLWAIGVYWLFWKAPLWWVPHADRQGYHLHGVEFLTGESFFYAMLLFLAGVATMLALRARRAERPVTLQAAPAPPEPLEVS